MSWYDDRTDFFAREAARRDSDPLPLGYRWATADETELHQNGGPQNNIQGSVWISDRGLAVPNESGEIR